jgi:hypothetical protein
MTPGRGEGPAGAQDAHARLERERKAYLWRDAAGRTLLMHAQAVVILNPAAHPAGRRRVGGPPRASPRAARTCVERGRGAGPGSGRRASGQHAPCPWLPASRCGRANGHEGVGVDAAPAPDARGPPAYFGSRSRPAVSTISASPPPALATYGGARVGRAARGSRWRGRPFQHLHTLDARVARAQSQRIRRRAAAARAPVLKLRCTPGRPPK